MQVSHLLPVARSANRGRASASPQIWRPSPIFALRLTYRIPFASELKFLICTRKEYRKLDMNHVVMPRLRSARAMLDRPNRGRVLASLEILRPLADHRS